MKESNLSKMFLPKWQAENGKDSHLFRNNTGAWKDKFDRWTFYGVGLWRRKNKKSPYRPVGGGDHVGWTSKSLCVILLEAGVEPHSFLGWEQGIFDQKIAIFTSIEIKTKGVATTQDQKDWKELVEKSGGIAEVIKEGEF